MKKWRKSSSKHWESTIYLRDITWTNDSTFFCRTYPHNYWIISHSSGWSSSSSEIEISIGHTDCLRWAQKSWYNSDTSNGEIGEVQILIPSPLRIIFFGWGKFPNEIILQFPVSSLLLGDPLFAFTESFAYTSPWAPTWASQHQVLSNRYLL